MDSLTQAALGASIGKAFYKDSNKGAIAGAAIATLPDLDVILYLFYDKIDMLSIHRGLSHSIAFSVLISLLLVFILKKSRWFEDSNYVRLLSFIWVVYFTHILLDTFTTYGTQLLLPFSNYRFGFDSINVVDPVYTLPLLFGLILSLKKKGKINFNKWGLIISSCYLIFTIFHKKHVNQVFKEKLRAEEIDYSNLLTVPVGIANLNWYGVAKSTDSIYIQHYATFEGIPKPFEAFPINEKYMNELGDELAKTMRWFAKGFYTLEKEGSIIRVYNLQVDMRGIISSNGKKAPTKGYFLVEKIEGKTNFSSGSWE